ncbi:MAG TPA: MBL fold metallo-hydrolase [Saprospiraceae bacterium]|nr:MBL fold metallo-hydrolase [Saprospiraceae bacterium]
MKLITDNCILFTSALYQTNSTLIDLGDKILLVDPSWLPEEINAIKNYIQQNYQDKTLWILITHFDYDHVWGVPAFPDAKIIAPSLEGLEHLGDKCLHQWKQWDQEHYINRPYLPSLPVPEFTLAESPSLIWNEYTLYFYHAPGHTADSYCCVIEPEGILIAGDYLCDVEIPWMGDSLISYKRTLEQFNELIEKHKISICIPGHGSIITNQKGIKERIEAGLKYLQLLSDNIVESENTIRQLISQYPFPLASQDIHELNKKFVVNNVS